MDVWTELGRGFTPEGDELLLRARSGHFELRMNGQELMASRAHESEEAMARWACAHLAGTEAARVLIGGLGFGYTLRAALDSLPATARVVVAELIPEVVAWVRGPVAELAGDPLGDPRVEVRIADAGEMLRQSAGGFDAIVLDIDNGPEEPVRPGNAASFGAKGLAAIRRALRPGGVLSIWSADPAAGFEERLRQAGFQVEKRDCPALPDRGGASHTVYLARIGV